MDTKGYCVNAHLTFPDSKCENHGNYHGNHSNYWVIRNQGVEDVTKAQEITTKYAAMKDSGAIVVVAVAVAAAAAQMPPVDMQLSPNIIFLIPHHHLLQHLLHYRIDL